MILYSQREMYIMKNQSEKIRSEEDYIAAGCAKWALIGAGMGTLASVLCAAASIHVNALHIILICSGYAAFIPGFLCRLLTVFRR